MKHEPSSPLFNQAPANTEAARKIVPEPLGQTITDEDKPRLAGQYLAVCAFMEPGDWRTLAAIAAAVGAPEASVSARLRDMRRGGYAVLRRRVPGGNGLHEYRAVLRTASETRDARNAPHNPDAGDWTP